MNGLPHTLSLETHLLWILSGRLNIQFTHTFSTIIGIRRLSSSYNFAQIELEHFQTRLDSIFCTTSMGVTDTEQVTFISPMFTYNIRNSYMTAAGNIGEILV